MGEMKVCIHQEDCPLLAQALQERLRYRADLRAERDGGARFRSLVAPYFKAARAMRAAQRAFKEARTEESRLASVRAAKDYDEAERAFVEGCAAMRGKAAPSAPQGQNGREDGK